MSEPKSSPEPVHLDLVVAEDDFSIAAVVCRLLRNRGHTVRHCGDGAEALEAIRASKPDAVLTDYQMPNMDGIELVQALAADESFRSIPILMLTARGHQVPEELRSGTGLVRLMAKPFSSRDLARAVDELVGECGREAA